MNANHREDCGVCHRSPCVCPGALDMASASVDQMSNTPAQPEDPYVGLAREYNAVCDQLSAATARVAELERELAGAKAMLGGIRNVLTRRLGGEMSWAHAELAALKLEVEAWRALAEYIARDDHGCIDANRGVDGCDLFVGVDADSPTGFEGTSCEKADFGACALDVARKLNLVTTPTPPDFGGKGE